MAVTYRACPEIVDNIMSDLKNDRYIPADKVFIHDAVDNPDNRVYYNDYDFLDAVGHYRSRATIDDAVKLLQERGHVSASWSIAHHLFETYSYRVKNSFVVPWKSFTPTMERLVYMLSQSRQPRKVLCIGGNCGYTLAWIAGCFWKSEHQEETEMYILEKNPSLLEISEQNLKGLHLKCEAHYLQGDANEILDSLEAETFDLVFLDTRRDIRILHKSYDKMVAGGWLLMHNASDPHFETEMREYLDFVRDESRFTDSILFCVDSKGLELSIKK